MRKGILAATVRPGPQKQALRKPKAGRETRTNPAKGSKRQGLDEHNSQKQAAAKGEPTGEAGDAHTDGPTRATQAAPHPPTHKSACQVDPRTEKLLNFST